MLIIIDISCRLWVDFKITLEMVIFCFCLDIDLVIVNIIIYDIIIINNLCVVVCYIIGLVKICLVVVIIVNVLLFLLFSIILSCAFIKYNKRIFLLILLVL